MVKLEKYTYTRCSNYSVMELSLITNAFLVYLVIGAVLRYLVIGAFLRYRVTPI